jgi:CHASE3 domain sensor protein
MSIKSPRLAALPSVEAKTLLGFVIGFSLLLIGGGYTYHTNVEFATTSEWVAHSQEIRAALAAVYGSLAGAELAERDYLLTSTRGISRVEGRRRSEPRSAGRAHRG